MPAQLRREARSHGLRPRRRDPWRDVSARSTSRCRTIERPAPGRADAGAAAGAHLHPSRYVVVTDHYVRAETRSRSDPAIHPRLGRSRPASRSCTTRKASATSSCPERVHLSRACSSSAATAIRPPGAPSAGYMSASAPPRWRRARDRPHLAERAADHPDGMERRAPQPASRRRTSCCPLRQVRHGRRQYQAVEYAGEAVAPFDAGAHDPVQHDGRTRRAGRPGRAGPVTIDYFCRPACGRRNSRARRLAQRRAGGSAEHHRFDAARLWRRRWPLRTARPTPRRSRTCRASRSMSPTSAPAPAPSSTTCAWPPACCEGQQSRERREADGRARLARRPGSRARRRQPRGAAARRERNCCRPPAAPAPDTAVPASQRTPASSPPPRATSRAAWARPRAASGLRRRPPSRRRPSKDGSQIRGVLACLSARRSVRR